MFTAQTSIGFQPEKMTHLSFHNYSLHYELGENLDKKIDIRKRHIYSLILHGPWSW